MAWLSGVGTSVVLGDTVADIEPMHRRAVVDANERQVHDQRTLRSAIQKN